MSGFEGLLGGMGGASGAGAAGAGGAGAGTAAGVGSAGLGAEALTPMSGAASAGGSGSALGAGAGAPGMGGGGGGGAMPGGLITQSKSGPMADMRKLGSLMSMPRSSQLEFPGQKRMIQGNGGGGMQNAARGMAVYQGLRQGQSLGDLLEKLAGGG